MCSCTRDRFTSRLSRFGLDDVDLDGGQLGWAVLLRLVVIIGHQDGKGSPFASLKQLQPYLPALCGLRPEGGQLLGELVLEAQLRLWLVGQDGQRRASAGPPPATLTQLRLHRLMGRMLATGDWSSPTLASRPLC